MNSAVGFLIFLVVLAGLAFNIWLVVIAIRFLRSGRKAFDTYTSTVATQQAFSRLAATDPGAVRPADPSWPVHRSPGTGA